MTKKNKFIKKAERSGTSSSFAEPLREQNRTGHAFKAEDSSTRLILLLLLACFAVYANTLGNGFVVDDMTQVLENRWIRESGHLTEMFTTNVWGFQGEHVLSNYYRPMMHVMYFATYLIFGLKAWGFHLVNLILHAANTVLVFLIVSRLTGSFAGINSRTGFFSVPFLTALVFAVHPVNTEAVNWIAAVPDLCYTFFCLLSFFWYLSAQPVVRDTRYLFSLAAFGLALFCKEPAATLPVILAAYDLGFRDRTLRPFLAASIRRYLPYVLVFAAYFAARANALGGLAPVKMQGELTSFQYILNAFPMFVRYIEKLVLPIGLRAYYTIDTITSLFQPKALLAVLIAAAYAAAAVAAYKKNRLVFFALILVAVPLLPTLYIPSRGGSPMGERYLYLPSAGFGILVSLALVRFREKLPQFSAVAVAAAIILAGTYSWATVARNRVWKDNIVLYTDTLRKSPAAEMPRGNFGIALLDAGKYDEAIGQFQVIIAKINPDSENAYYNMGRAYLKKEAYDEAIAAFRKAVSLNPNDLDAYQNLVLASVRSDRIGEASAEYAPRFGLKPNAPETFVVMGADLERSGHAEEAIALYRKAIAQDGKNFPARYSLGSALLNVGRIDEAIDQFQAALRLKPEDPNLRNRLGVAFGQKGMYDKSIEQLEAAVRLAPDKPAFRNNLEHARQLNTSGSRAAGR